jgi:RHS repeat-associated protein
VTIPYGYDVDYTYDPLYRLTAADYSTGQYYHYAYDAVGNRLSQQTHIGTTNYTYDSANRLMQVGAITYTWDDNGNLLSDGTNTYAYDSANRLKSITGASLAVSYAYSGLGDRLQETVNGGTTTFVMDLNSGLTQALSDGTNTYLYGVDRIAQAGGSGTEYFLGDALGSVRQLADISGAVVLAQAYDPYGVTANVSGAAQTSYGFAGEYTSAAAGLIYLRARQYDPSMGRFTSRDTWGGDYNRPLSLNRWNYVQSNPIVYRDPSGQWCVAGFDWGPGRECTNDEKERWAEFYSKAAGIWNEVSNDAKKTQGFATGFFIEYFDAVSLFWIPSLILALSDKVRNCDSAYHMLHYDQWVVAGRHFGRAFVTSQGLIELGLGLAGVGSGITVSLSGIGALVGVPTAELSAVLAGHGALVLTHVGISEQVAPLPRLYFSASTGGGSSKYPRNWPSGRTNEQTAWFNSEGEARQLAREKLGRDPVEIEPYKWRSQDGKWQYRAKPDDVAQGHVHLEELDPATGEVLQNWHLRWPAGTGR